MATKKKSSSQKRADFERYVKLSTDIELTTMLEICDMQYQHPDHANRCWSGSPHNVPFLEVRSILLAETKKRGIKWATTSQKPKK